MEFEVQYKEDGVYLEAFIDTNKAHKKINTEYISQFQSVSWGIDHCLLLDKKHRVFSMGFNKHGRLGHGDENDRLKPQMIASLKDKGVIDVQCGAYHSAAVTNTGEIYTWGPGNAGRLGLGYDEETRSNPT